MTPARLATNGGFSEDGAFRERLLARLVERHAISDDLARKLVAWTHPGFSSHIAEAIPFENKKAIEDLACYLVRAPLSLQKPVYLDGAVSTGFNTQRAKARANSTHERVVADPVRDSSSAAEASDVRSSPAKSVLADRILPCPLEEQRKSVDAAFAPEAGSSMLVSGRFACASAARSVGLVIASLVAGLHGSTAEAIPTGKVIERARCRDYPGQTYALYVPSSYHAGRSWPVLYAFDPMARGDVPVRLFSQAAERLGFVVAAPNNSRNGPLPPILTAMQAVWADTHLRLALDPVRVYATGMSGGTLPARLLALDQGVGIIACAGALDPSELPKGGRRLDWLGVAGDADFNFSLTKSVVEAMVARGAVARFASFDGGHAWPPEPLAARALEWLELGAMRGGHRSRDVALIDALYEQGLARARELLAGGRWDDAAEENAALAREFAGLKPVEALVAEAKRLRDTPEAKRDRKREARLAERDISETRLLVTLRTGIEHAASVNPVEDLRSLDPSAPAVLEGVDVWSLQIQLDSRIARVTREVEATDADKRIVARRILDGFYISTFFAGGERRRDRRFDASVADFEICARMRPKTASPVYEKARTHAARGDRKAALAALRAAIALGFGDANRLVEDPEWSQLRDDPEYGALRETMGSKPASP